ncbi:hypothetical protein AGMMS50229_19360 [Campylobacterota bacterium]|nr:hypothetical protein AGMMS50229_19360 [Campylobacterota bacterium]
MIPGLEELAQEILEIEGHDYIFHTSFFSSKDPYMDQIAMLALLEAENIDSGLTPNPFNVTAHKRPGTFTSRPAGKALLAIAAILIAAIAWPGYYYTKGFFHTQDVKVKLAALGQSKAEFNALIAARDQLRVQREALLKSYQEASDKFNTSKSLLGQIHEKRVVHKPIAQELAKVYAYLTEYDVRVTGVETKERDATIKLRAGNDTRITRLLEKLAAENYAPSMDRIAKNETAFEADLKVRLP